MDLYFSQLDLTREGTVHLVDYGSKQSLHQESERRVNSVDSSKVLRVTCLVSDLVEEVLEVQLWVYNDEDFKGFH